MSLVVLVLLAFALSTRKSQPNNIRTQDVLDLKGDVKSIDGQLSTLIKMLRSTNNGPASRGQTGSYMRAVIGAGGFGGERR